MGKEITNVFDKPKEMLVSIDNEKWKKAKVIGLFNNWAMVGVRMEEDNVDNIRYLNYPYHKCIDSITEEINKFSKEQLDTILNKI